ncbi:MAG: SIMPL domain-containing protein [Candidatus Omnitrophica bacterium]|nr:SIMPL domain-containing protein [Candidatus Omnitrophota bacterium]
MKRVFFFLSLMLLFIISSVKAQQIKQEEDRIITSGEATVWVEPDRTRIFLGIETLRETIDTAHKENAEKMKKVVAALKALKIKGMLIKAPSYNVSLVKEPTYEATKAGRLPKIIGYKVTQNFTVLLKNKDPLILSKNASYVIDTALKNGVNIIEKVVFFKENDSQERRKALKLAVKDAISNAKAIAEAAGVSIKSYTLINSSTYYWQPPQIVQITQAFTPQEAGRATTTLIAGKIPISCKVQLHCIIK